MHLFVMDPLSTLNLALDSSLRLAHELDRRGQPCYLATIDQLSRSSRDGISGARCARLRFGAAVTDVTLEPPARRLFREFRGVHMRKDPPFDLAYIEATWLLDLPKEQPNRPKVFNAPAALRSINEKLAIFDFPEFCRPALVSAQPDEIEDFILTECHGDAVIKPLNLFGGRGVERLTAPAKTQMNTNPSFLEKIRVLTNNGTAARLIQPFDDAIFTGEVRAFAVGGKPLAWCLKKPAPGNFLANTRAGATLEPYAPSAREVESVTKAAARLLDQGVSLVGFDLIGGFISEVNITSPRLLQAADDKRNYYSDMAHWIISACE